MILTVLYMFIAVNIISCTGLTINMNREYFYHGKDLFFAQLQCTENIREDTQISALVNMSVYRISEPEGKILVASISESDSKLQENKRAGTRVDGKISKTFSELDIFFSNSSDCNVGIFLCEIHYVNTTGSIDRFGKKILPTNSRDTFLMMNLKAKTSNYGKSVDTMADFLKSFEDPDRLKGADMTMSLHMSHSGFDKSITDKISGPTGTELNTNYKQISSSSRGDLVDDKINNLILDVNKTLQMMETKLTSNRELNRNSLAVLNEAMQTLSTNIQNQTEQLSIRLNEMGTHLNKTATQDHINTTLNLVAGLNKTLEELKYEYNLHSLILKITKQCVRNDKSNLREQMIVKLDGRKLALCDTKTEGGGWIVIQDSGELRFDMKYKGKSYYMVYSNVTVGNEADLYRIKFTYKTGNATDSFSVHNGMAFSTLDKDNDSWFSNCAESYKGGWWYSDCHSVNVNGVWASKVYGVGINWYGISTQVDSLQQVEMKLRRLEYTN